MSETRVIHIRDADFRNPNVIYIGRRMPRKGLPGSIWANPFKIDAVIVPDEGSASRHQAGVCREHGETAGPRLALHLAR